MTLADYIRGASAYVPLQPPRLRLTEPSPTRQFPSLPLLLQALQEEQGDITTYAWSNPTVSFGVSIYHANHIRVIFEVPRIDHERWISALPEPRQAAWWALQRYGAVNVLWFFIHNPRVDLTHIVEDLGL